ncbi:MAG TPA: GTP diphosphokinase, partial [Pseudomonadales bacterium]|nr:GTP diphosphokinase [Pseudomonadales bacterium]
MVKVREDQPFREDGSVDLEAWLARIHRKLSWVDIAQLEKACHVAKRAEDECDNKENAWADSASSYITGLEMADILADLKLDSDALVAAVLYRAVREGKLPIKQVDETFGGAIAKLIDGVIRMAAISAAMNPTRKVVLGQSGAQLDNLRKMLVAMVDDVRVALIKLAERTCAIRAVKDASTEKRQRVAQEVFDIYAPLAHRLGIGHIKWELEDLSFRYLQPDSYKKIAKLLDEKRVDREQYIERVVKSLQTALGKMGIKADVTGRAKHIYSIWRKMKRKGIDFSQVYDVRAVRVLVPEVRDCYAALGVVHSLWQHIPKEFDDYIATPKDNGYRSLHTAVLGPESKVLEVQIRTHEMHDEAELGVCAHWRYKEGVKAKQRGAYDEKIAWLRQVLEWQEELGDTGVSGLMAQFGQEVVDERVYVFTPEGHVVDLAMGATPLDFSYHIHTEVGNRCRGAKVNGRIVPLNYTLRTGDQVQILTGKEAAPSRDWLNPNLGFIQTSRARAKVQHWFKQQDRSKNVADGRALLEREFQRLAITDVDLNTLLPKLNVKTVEDIYAAIGAGDLRPAQVLNLLPNALRPLQEELPLAKPRARKGVGDVEVGGVDSLLTQVAGCCKPVPGDDVVGYVSHGRGVIIHRSDCNELAQLQAENPNRIIAVTWNESPNQVYPVDVYIKAYDRQGLLRDITNVLANEHVNVTAVNTQSHKN